MFLAQFLCRGLKFDMVTLRRLNAIFVRVEQN